MRSACRSTGLSTCSTSLTATSCHRPAAGVPCAGLMTRSLTTARLGGSRWWTPARYTAACWSRATGHADASSHRSHVVYACSYCGHELSDSSSATVLPSGPAAQRLLWYAHQGADLIHGAEVVALMQSDEAASLSAAYARLAAKARDVGLREVAAEFEKIAHAARRALAGSRRSSAPCGGSAKRCWRCSRRLCRTR